tara:strand:+ start:743 stop:1177 length:435 start_codon:yes stop_codon:yes gene_type:complete
VSRSGALSRIDALLSEITDPAFVGVVRGEPLAISGSPLLAFWITGRVSDTPTLGDIGSRTSMLIRAYFRMQDSQDVRETLEEEVWDTMVQVNSKLSSDANLSDNVTDSNVGSATVGYINMSGGVFRAVSIPYEVQILGEVTVTS